jgi:hypothetical protein
MTGCEVVPAPSSMSVVTHCAPHAARVTLKDEPQWHRPYVTPIGVTTYDGVGEADSPTRLSWDDVKHGHIERHCQSRRRFNTIPLWTRDKETAALVLTAMWEQRAGIRQPGKNQTLQERLRSAQKKLDSNVKSKLLPWLDRLCSEFVNCSDAARKAQLQKVIHQLDRECMVICKGGPGLILRVWHLAWDLGLDSVGVASDIGGHVSATWVRQILFRSRRCYERLQAEGQFRK